MPKLPDNYVKAPSFDNPLRSTAAKAALVERRVTLRLDPTTWELLSAAAERENATPEALAQRALDRWLSDAHTRTPAPSSPEPARATTLRALVIEQLQERLVRRSSWMQRLLGVRDALRERRV